MFILIIYRCAKYATSNIQAHTDRTRYRNATRFFNYQKQLKAKMGKKLA